MNTLQIFDNMEFGKIRMIDISGQPHAVGSDAARALGYARPNDAITQHCRCRVKHRIPHPQNPERELEVNVIPEGDLYRLIVHSQLPSADKFERWIFDEVIPTIRQTGTYTVPQTLPEALRLAADLAEQNGALALELSTKDQIIGEMRPKVEYVDRILSSRGLMPITAIAKDYGMSAVAFNQLLHKNGIQYKQGGQWFLYREYQSMGYTQSQSVDIIRTDGRQDVKLSTKWTQKGRLFLYELLKADGTLPMIERNGGKQSHETEKDAKK